VSGTFSSQEKVSGTFSSNASQPKEEIENIRYAIKRSQPDGLKEWVSSAVAQFGLENTLRSRGRPGKGT
jgi:hypothetical protein